MDNISYEDVVGWLLIIIVIGSFLYSLYRSETYNFIRYFLQSIKTKPSWINTLLYNGGACVIGKASGEPLISPITGIKCVYWGIEVQDLRWFTWNPRISRKNWKTLYSATSNNLFEICDGTGEIRVNPQDGIFLGGGFQYFNEITLQNFNKSGVYSGNLSGFAQFREFIVTCDMPICVWGSFSLEGATKILQSTKEHKLIIGKKDWKSSTLELFYDLITELGPYFLFVLFPLIIFLEIAVSGTIFIKIIPPILLILFIFFGFFLGQLADNRNVSD